MPVDLTLLWAVLVIQVSSIAAAISCIDSFKPLDVPLFGFISEVGLNWPQVQKQCPIEHPGFWMLMKHKNFSDDELALCPVGSLVPIGVFRDGDVLKWDRLETLNKTVLQQEELVTLKYIASDSSGIWGALRWPYGGLVLVGPETKFRCVVCQISDRSKVITVPVYPPHNNSIYAYDIELISDDIVDYIGLVANGSDLTNRLLTDLAEVFNISVKALRWHGAKLIDDGLAVVHVYYDQEGEKIDWVDYVHWNDEYVDRKKVDNFEIRLIKLNTQCLDNKTSLQNSKQEVVLTGIIDYTLDLDSMIINTRECYWDGNQDEARWSNYIAWKVNWRYCDPDDMKEAFPVGGAGLNNSLKNSDLTGAFQLRKLLDLPDADISLKYPVSGANLFLVFHTFETANSAFAILTLQILQNLAQIYARGTLSGGKMTELIRSPNVNVLASNLVPDDPVIGIAVTFATRENRNKSSVTPLVKSWTNKTHVTSHIVITVSESIALTAQRLAFATYAAHLDLPTQTKRYDSSIDGWLSIVQVVFTRNLSQTFNYEEDFIDIAFNATFHIDTLKGKCVERVFAKDEWYGGNCVILKSMRDALTVCRCKNIPHEVNVANGVYLIYGFDASFSSYLGNNFNLVIVTVCVCIMSTLGLLSVILTAIMFKKWREDQGHQIFLQMIFALTVNLLIGFVNNFVKIDTKSIACIAIGVVRHYSFLAMFFWMMILSSLQIKRLTTISGSKSTTHLLLKVSLIAWGLPMIPIVVLLSWNPGFYKSEISDRGYCYPEGFAFQATVQGPAGLILIANMFIFLVILNHIYGWFKCGKTMVVRKHTDERAEQLRRLTTSIFIFFLFGFTWLFHFLSEEGIINSEFLFEFLFLITASFHLFMLSFFFIILDKSTRDLWFDCWGSFKKLWCPKKGKELVRQKVIVGRQKRNIKAPVNKAKRARAVKVKTTRARTVTEEEPAV